MDEPGIETQTPLTYVKAELMPDNTVRVFFPDDEIIVRGLIEALRFEFDERVRKVRLGKAITQARKDMPLVTPANGHALPNVRPIR